MLEKILTKLALPCGLMWLGIGVLTVAAWRAKRRRLAGSLLLLFVVYTLAGNAWTCGLAFNYLERDYRDTGLDRSAQFDAVVILGGGSGEAPNGEPQLDAEGDRVMLGARLYHGGQTRFIVCTGADPGKMPQDPPGAAETAALLLADVGIPNDRIIQIGGRSTKEELAAAKRLIDDRHWQHVGLITSAWHMQRAMRHARNMGLDLRPLPADFRSGTSAGKAIDLIPSSRVLRNLEIAYREFLAGLVGR